MANIFTKQVLNM